MIHIWITILILPSISCNYTLVNGLLLAGKTNQSSISSDLEISSNSSETSSIEEHGNDYMVGGIEDEEYDDYENENEEDVETNNLDISPKFAGKGEQQMAFIFKQGECSSSLIHRDWLLTAAHCLGSALRLKFVDENGDLTVPSSSIHVRADLSGSLTPASWGLPLNLTKDSSEDYGGWRRVLKVYLQDFQGENQIYKGNDLMLIKLAPEVSTNTFGTITPVCLPDPKTVETQIEQTDFLYFAGFGRRRLPHCITDSRGPSMHEICGRPKSCTSDHRTTKCGLDFLYEGKEHFSCLINETTPSAKNPVCQNLVKALNMTDFKKTTLVFDESGKLLTVCYQFNVKEGGKGWCSTRSPWLNENTEPKFDEGWGFCGTEDYQSKCNEIAEQVMDTRLMGIHRLNNEYCVEQLKINLAKEMPEVEEREFNDLDKVGTICVGKNVTLKMKNFEVFEVNKSLTKFTKIKLDETRRKNVEAEKGDFFHAIDGAACFGDSGGPLFKFVLDESGIKKPVLMGVMSYVLWGTCKSRFDPSYYTLTQHNLDFIFKYVSKDEMCYGSGKSISMHKKTKGF